MRVRIRRFERLRLIGKSRYSQLVEVAGGESEMDEQHCIVPPTPRVSGSSSCCVFRHAEFAQLGVDPRAPLPLLELQRPQTMANPLVVVRKDSRGMRQLEVLFRALGPIFDVVQGRSMSRACSLILPDTASREARW